MVSEARKYSNWKIVFVAEVISVDEGDVRRLRLDFSRKYYNSGIFG